MQVDLVIWRSLRTSWRDIERFSEHLGWSERARLARAERAIADDAVRRIEAELASPQ